MKRFAFVPVLLTLAGLALVAGCGGGSGSAGNPTVPFQQQHETAAASFTILIPEKQSASSSERKPEYVSSSTKSASFSLPGMGSPQVVQLSSSSPNCSAVSGGLQCIASFQAPIGVNQTLTVQTYASTDGTGTPLSIGSTTVTVASGTTNTLSVTLSGVVSSFTVVASSATITGTQTGGFALIGLGAHQFVVNALDAQGNIIVGPGAPTFNVSSTGTLALAVTEPTIAAPNVFSVSPPSTLSSAGGSVNIAAQYGIGQTNPCSIVAESCITSVNFTMQGLLAIISQGPQVTLYPEGSTTKLLALTANLKGPSAGVFDSNGNLFIADETNNDVLEYAPPYNGTPTTISGLYLPDALTVDPAGDLYVANDNNAAPTVLEFAPGTTTPSRTISPGDPVVSMCLDPSGDLFTASGGGNGQIEEYAPAATTAAYSVTGVLFPNLVACDPSGNVFVARYGYDDNTAQEITSVDKYQPKLVPFTSLGSITGPAALATDANYIYVGNGGGASTNVILFNTNYTTHLTITSGLAYPDRIVVDGQGNIFVDDHTHNEVLEYPVGTTAPSITIPGLVTAYNAGMALSP